MREYLTSNYIAAANRLAGAAATRQVMVYVESYDDIFFWRHLLAGIETPSVRFEVHLPSHDTLNRGKKQALSNRLGARLGKYMIACVDADYDYLQQGHTQSSCEMLENPFVFHTFAYAIENHQCYAPALQNVCLMSTLCDRRIFPFTEFMADFSRTVWPLFVWNVWCYRFGHFKQFSMTDFNRLVTPTDLFSNLPSLLGETHRLAEAIARSLDRLRGRINQKVALLQKQFPQARKTYKPLKEELLGLGVTPETTYLFMRGHDVFDSLVVPIVTAVCDNLRRYRERNIREAAASNPTQRYNELSSYQNSVVSAEEMLRKHTEYASSPLYRRIQDEIRRRIVEAP